MQNKFYWIKFGYNSPSDDDILSQLGNLYYEATNREPPDSSREIRKRLEQYFRRDKNALLILDDVLEPRIIKTFDFHCKTLVITTNISLLGERPKIVIEMKDGFTLAESLNLFAKALDISVDQLCPEAAKIHGECNGMPILIAMFAAQFNEFKDDMKNNCDRWQYYLRALRNKDENNKVMGKFLAKQEVTFELCIKQLSDEERLRYENLVIFSEYVNITPKTLGILWDKTPFHAEELMVSLCHKSLAIRQWNDDLNSYIYGVHDLLLCHLRNRMNNTDLINQHARFVRKYERYCHGDFSKLPNDNYSYSYIGHHLMEARMTDRLKDLYLNFNFIEAKLRNCSVTDFLIDLKKYKIYITDDDEHRNAQLSDLEVLLKTQARVLADHRQHKCLDLVQIALNQDPPGYYNILAHEIAKNRPKHLYLFHEKQHPSIDDTINEEVPTEVNCVRFTDDPQKILIGSKTGKILLWDCEKKKTIFEFTGHEKSEIIKIIVSQSDAFFIALNNQSVIKQFLLKPDEELSDCETEVHTPREKQSFWSDMYHPPIKDNSTNTYLTEHGLITDIAMSLDDETIAACTDKGAIIIWKVNGTIICALDCACTFQRLTFSKNSQYLHVIDTTGSIVIFKEAQESYIYNTLLNALWHRNSDPKKVIHIQEIPGSATDLRTELMIVTAEGAVILMLEQAPTGIFCNPSKRLIAENTNSKFVAATITYDSEFLITTDSESLVKIWRIKSGWDSISSFLGGKNSIDTYCEGNGDCHLIISGDKFSIQRRAYKPEFPPQSKRKPLFDAIMKPLGEYDIVAQEIVGNKNKISLHIGYDLISESRPFDNKIIAMVLHFDGNQVLYSTDNNGIFLFDSVTKNSTKIMTLTEPAKFLKFIKIDGVTNVVCREQADLKFWNGIGAEITIRAGNVMAIYCIRKKFIITVARDGAMMIWKISKTEWSIIFKQRSNTDDNTDNTDDNIVCYSCLSSNENILSILKINNQVALLEIQFNEIDEPVKIAEFTQGNFFIPDKLTCCSFSPDDSFLAVGTDVGTISVSST